MSDPISWIALQAVENLLKNIKIDNGFHTDAGDQVTLEPAQLNEDEELTEALRVVEDDSETNQTNNRSRENEMSVIIECYIKVDDLTAQYKAHLIRQDVVDAIPKRSRDLPVNVHTLEVTSKRIVQRPNGFPYIVCSVGLRVGIIETSSSN